MEVEDLDMFFDSIDGTDLMLFDENAPTLDQIDFSAPQSGAGIRKACDPQSDPVFPGICGRSSDLTAGDGYRGETSGEDRWNRAGAFSGFGNPVGVPLWPVPLWPVPPVPYSCTCCHVLREITHTNGVQFSKLEIHGALGIISHVVLQTRYVDDSNGPPEYQMFDFCKKSIEAVKELLVQYCEDRRQAGYTMVQDPLSTFYEALCVGIINANTDDFFDGLDDLFESSDLSYPTPGYNSLAIHPLPMNQVGPGIALGPSKGSLAAQRVRTANLTLKDFAPYYCFPIEEAAKKMNVCPTVVKKICRKYGLERWPYRKIKSIENKISEKKKVLETCSREGRRLIEAEIRQLEGELAQEIEVFYRS